MNLWLGSRFHFLFAALVLGSSALTPEECKPLVTPLSMGDLSETYGRVNLLAGYTTNFIYKGLLNLTDSSWVKSSASTEHPGVIIMSQENRINGTCFALSSNITYEGNTATMQTDESSSSYRFLPSCDGCGVIIINSTATNGKKLAQLLGLNIDVDDVISARTLYLLGRESTLKEEELERFKQQASCLGFSGDPDFIYNPEKGFCAEGEGLKISV